MAENTFRDVNIALVNELAMVCSTLGANVLEVIELANRHPRIDLHRPGPGVGGHCLAVDPYFLIQKGLNKNGLITKARAINEGMPSVVVKELEEILKDMEPPTVSIFGVTYKGNVDDTRGCPALELIKGLEERGIKTRAYDPHVDVFAYKLYTLKEAVNGSDCILITADHEEFKEVDIEYIAPLMRHKIIFDTKNCIDSCKWMEYGFKTYVLRNKRR